MKQKYTPIIAMDYTDGATRRTTFQLCTPENGRLAAYASLQFEGEQCFPRYIAALAPRLPAIIRLARVYRKRSIPAVFLPAPRLSTHVISHTTEPANMASL